MERRGFRYGHGSSVAVSVGTTVSAGQESGLAFTSNVRVAVSAVVSISLFKRRSQHCRALIHLLWLCGLASPMLYEQVAGVLRFHDFCIRSYRRCCQSRGREN